MKPRLGTLLAAALALASAQVAAAQQPAPKESPLSVDDERASFQLPKGFVVDLIAADPDLAKVVDVAFDDSGRMWATTATEYPLDANESPAAAELYQKGGKDRVLVFDSPTARERQKPRTFAEGLAMPMSVLPIGAGGAGAESGVLVAQGPQIFWLRDKDGDGKADERTLVLDGFGIQDSHLMPHRLTRGPGEWIYVMQGAFNSSQVKTKSGETVAFDQCKIGRFKVDGSKFEVVGTGLNNIWGFVIDAHGDFWIQEANDLGYPVVPFYLGASYPGIGDHRAHPYSPFLPALSHFEVGGTGLSGLALSEDEHGFPAPYERAFILANPIARSVQAVAVKTHEGVHDLELQKDLVQSSDPWFRPVAVHYGPDGALYVVDWYNKIISHNEVSRTDPGRDRTHGRIWRVRTESQTAGAVVDVTKVATPELAAHLAANSTWEARAAWHQIVDRKAVELAPALATLAHDRAASIRVRQLALWSLEGLGRAKETVDAALVADPDASIRREALSALGEAQLASTELAALFAPVLLDADDRVRQAAIGALASLEHPDDAALALLLRFVRPALSVNESESDPNRRTNGLERQALREFERSLIRAALEKHAGELAKFAAGSAFDELTPDARSLAALALPEKDGALKLAALLPTLGRAPSAEEVRTLASQLSSAPVAKCFAELLAGEATRSAVLGELLAVRERIGAVDLSTSIAAAVRADLAAHPDDAARDRAVALAAGFQVRELAGEVTAIASGASSAPRKAAAVRALIVLGTKDVALLRRLALGAAPGSELQSTCVTAIAEVKDASAISALVELWPSLNNVLRSKALNVLASNREGASALLDAIEADAILPSELDGDVLQRLATVLAGDPKLVKLEKDLADRLRPVLRLDGGDSAGETNLELPGPFTLEAWVELDPPVTNQDALLGTTTAQDFNFADGRFRWWGGSELGDLIIATKPIAPSAWTHVALTRDDKGKLALYVNGELDPAVGKAATIGMKGLNIGVAVARGGTRGSLSELRVWNVARTADEIGANFRRSFAGEKLEHLVLLATGDGPWGALKGAAHVVRTLDAPELLDATAQRALDSKFARYKGLAARRGNATRGGELFANTCMTCHSLHGQGAKIGPSLDGIGLRSMDSLLRAVLTPSAAVESGYRLLRVETDSGEMLDGLLASEDEFAIVLRRQNREDLKLERAHIRRLHFEQRSVMPDGLLESLSADDASALFAYLATQK